MTKIGIVSINLQYKIPNGVNELDFLENVDLPKEYIVDSFEIVKIIEEK